MIFFCQLFTWLYINNTSPKPLKQFDQFGRHVAWVWGFQFAEIMLMSFTWLLWQN